MKQTKCKVDKLLTRAQFLLDFGGFSVAVGVGICDDQITESACIKIALRRLLVYVLFL